MQFVDYSSNGVSVEFHSLEEMFPCLWDSGWQSLRCNALIRGHELSTHLREVHGIHGPDNCRVSCLWKSCNTEFNKESLARHIEETHMRIAYKCDCGSTFSRRDTLTRHKKHAQH
ncbi:hypothetical protein BDR04DRAFT_1232090 [Suillus decipiens]|nr:hypothetical protein BDR04DRAFT_1232090 [Suillus decipiens]